MGYQGGSNTMNDFKLSKNFNLSEFECTHKDHKHTQVDEELIEKLQLLRDRLGVPLTINSAYRCPERNKQVGGSKNSLHMAGKAVDISTHNIDMDIDALEVLADHLGFDGIGKYNTFIHLDTRGYKARWDNR